MDSIEDYRQGRAVLMLRLRDNSAGLAMSGRVWQAGGMKKQAADQSFHDRRYQERKRAEAAKKVPAKKKVAEASGKQSGESRIAGPD
jgi:hypothetical protein